MVSAFASYGGQACISQLNPDFKPLEFERFKNETSNNYFVLSPQYWIEGTPDARAKAETIISSMADRVDFAA